MCFQHLEIPQKKDVCFKLTKGFLEKFINKEKKKFGHINRPMGAFKSKAGHISQNHRDKIHQRCPARNVSDFSLLLQDYRRKKNSIKTQTQILKAELKEEIEKDITIIVWGPRASSDSYVPKISQEKNGLGCGGRMTEIKRHGKDHE